MPFVELSDAFRTAERLKVVFDRRTKTGAVKVYRDKVAITAIVFMDRNQEVTLSEFLDGGGTISDDGRVYKKGRKKELEGHLHLVALYGDHCCLYVASTPRPQIVIADLTPMSVPDLVREVRELRKLLRMGP